MTSRLWSFGTIPAVKPQIQLTKAQLSLILGLESVLQKAGLGLICPFCAGSEPCDGILTTNNDPWDLSWKIDCDCRHRVGANAGVMPLQPSGDLILLAAELLKDARLDIRCLRTHANCRYTPIRTQRTATQIRVACECARMTFKASNPAQPAANPS